MVILKYSNELKEHIKTLNMEWLQQYFSVEENDIVQLSDPENEIIKKGGYIYYAAVDHIIAGTATLMKIDDSTYELAKMAVTKKYQGQGIGRKLVVHCIEVAKTIGAEKLILYSNKKLVRAIELYEKYGFVEVAMDKAQYKRADIKMELVL